MNLYRFFKTIKKKVEIINNNGIEVDNQSFEIKIMNESWVEVIRRHQLSLAPPTT